MGNLKTLAGLLVDRGPCPVCDEDNCTHRFYGDDHYRLGDPTGKHPRYRDPATHIRAPHRIVDEELERVVFATGDLMTEEEARRYGVLPPPADPGAPARRKGRRQAPAETGPKGPDEDRARRPAEDR